MTTSFTIIVNTSVPQGFMLTAALFFLFTHNCLLLRHHHQVCWWRKIIIINALSTVMKEAYRAELQTPTSWCQNNNLLLSITKTKNLMVDYRKQQNVRHASIINMRVVKTVTSFRFTSPRTWTGRWTLFSLRTLRKIKMDSGLLCKPLIPAMAQTFIKSDVYKEMVEQQIGMWISCLALK